MKRFLVLFLLLFAAVNFGCSEDETTVEAEPLEAWRGAEAHMEFIGSINGEEINIALEGVGNTSLRCVREYEYPPNLKEQAQMVEIKIQANLDINGVNRLLELEIKRHNFQEDGAGTEILITPRDQGEPAAGAMWVEWEWHDPSTDETSLELVAISGTFLLEHFTGTPDSNGIIPDNDGEVGGFLDMKFTAEDSVKLSFTVPCRNTIETVVGGGS